MKEYIQLIVALIGLIVGLIGMATQLTRLEVDSQLMRYTALLGYIVFAGGIVWYVLKRPNESMPFRHLSFGALYLLTIPFFIWVGSWLVLPKAQPVDPCNEYGIKIDKPSSGYNLVNGQVTIRGTITRRPPPRRLQLIAVAGNQYWPSSVEQLEVTETSWRGQSYGEGDYIAAIAYVGDSGRIFFDYFQKADEINNYYPGIDALPNDVFECDSVFVSGQ